MITKTTHLVPIEAYLLRMRDPAQTAPLGVQVARRQRVMSKTPSEILDGADLNQDLHYLIGYVWAEGNQKREFPSIHLTELAEYIIKKYPLPDTQEQAKENYNLRLALQSIADDCEAQTSGSVGMGRLAGYAKDALAGLDWIDEVTIAERDLYKELYDETATQDQGWQDISTAPEDTVVLLFDGEDIGLGFADKKSEDYGATHWMPLPAPPEVK